MLLRKLSLALIPIALAAGQAMPGRAQTDPSGRYAFADTTLLRDTLGLTFVGLFPLADSLEITPDSLRALSIRHRLPLSRLVALADSLHVPVDSVGVTILRERFNPLATREAANDFTYNTVYNLLQTRSSWTNGSDFNFVRGGLFVRNVTTIQLDRLETGGRTALWQTREASTEAGWRLSPDYSVGGRVVLNRFHSDDPTSITSVGEAREEYQLSLRAKHRPTRGITSEMNWFGGVLDLRSAEQERSGFSAESNGQIRHVSGRWYVHEVKGRMTASWARLRVVPTGVQDQSRDLIGSVNGNLSLFNQAPVAFRTAYNIQASSVGQPDVTGLITRHKTAKGTLDASLRTRFGKDGQASLTQRFGLSDQITALNGPSSRNSSGIVADARTTWLGCAIDARFQNDFARSETPRASTTGGYGERSISRQLESTLTRRLFGRLNARVNARIGINSYRYHVIGDYGTPPVSRDQAQQSYRLDGTYLFTETFNSGVGLEVSRNQLVNLPSASTAANHTLRSYRGEWRWTYRLFRGLTATQRNTVGANYTAYNFLAGADRLALDYGTATTLNAVLSPRLSVDLNHAGQVQPSGNWSRAADGLYYFRPADEARSFTLSTRIQYTPTGILSLTLHPEYRSSDRDGTVNGVQSPQRLNRSLSFTGSANLNVPVGGGGLLTGSIGRTYVADRSTTFNVGAPTLSPLSEIDYWNATLQFSWRPS